MDRWYAMSEMEKSEKNRKSGDIISTYERHATQEIHEDMNYVLMMMSFTFNS